MGVLKLEATAPAAAPFFTISICRRGVQSQSPFEPSSVYSRH